jgi:hypothetical protein
VIGGNPIARGWLASVVTSMLSYMGICEPEEVRARIYDGRDTDDEEKWRRFIEALAGPGVLDCPAYDPLVLVLQERGWLPSEPELEPNPDGPGRVGRWRLTDVGRRAWERLR